MQTQEGIEIDSWDMLFTMFTTLKPPHQLMLPQDLRMIVLRAIADPNTKIDHSWRNCLFAVATKAAAPSIRKVSSSNAARVLGIPRTWVVEGVRVWDSGKYDEHLFKVKKTEFRNRIREYLANIEKTRELAHV